jgi:hypothetical protein
MLLSLACSIPVYAEEEQAIHFRDLYSIAISEDSGHLSVDSAVPGEKISFAYDGDIMNLDKTKYATSYFIIKDYNTKKVLAKIRSGVTYTMPNVPIYVYAEIKNKTDAALKLYAKVTNKPNVYKASALAMSEFAVIDENTIDPEADEQKLPVDFNKDGKTDAVIKAYKVKSSDVYATITFTSAGRKLAGKSYTTNFKDASPNPFVPYSSLKISIVKNKISLSLKKVKVKRSAKKLTLTARLKLNNKIYKNKKVTFYFGKRKYTAKTNSKGYAKVTIKRSVLRKLKKGKKITYKAKFSTKTVKRTATVLK